MAGSEQDKSGFVEKAGWYLTGIGLVTLALGVFGGINNLAALGLVMTVGGLIAGGA